MLYIKKLVQGHLIRTRLLLPSPTVTHIRQDEGRVLIVQIDYESLMCLGDYIV